MSFKKWHKSGEPYVWLNAGAVALSVVMVFGLLALIAVRGMGHFWPADVAQMVYADNGQQQTIAGEFIESDQIPRERIIASGEQVNSDAELIERHLVKFGNRDIIGLDFGWIIEPNIIQRSYPEDLVVMERREWGNFYGYMRALKQDGQIVAQGPAAWEQFHERLDRALDLHGDIEDIEGGEIGSINYDLERLRLKERGHELRNTLTPAVQADLEAERESLNRRYETLQEELLALYEQINRDSVVMATADGREREVNLASVVRVYQPNAMGVVDKLGYYFAKLWEFVSDDPREANTEGGIFPAIFGTVMMVITMSIMVTPMGVVAAVYLREYAKQGPLVRLIRIAVNNLAGVPSIVYGVFGLGFFVYFLGGNLDALFFPEALPSPTFGTPGLMWASITLALLTLPVVIVATEEGLSRIPRNVREGSLALGATKVETLWRTVLPMASPAMMTGLILAIARAAGEVAPLMLVGVVKLAPSLPLDGDFPYLHLDRKFMHLGFHIYDVGFQSPNVEAARPLVYATALLLVAVIIVLNLTAIHIRNHLREKYRALEQ